MILNRELKYNGYLKIEALAVKTPSDKVIQREVLLKQNAVAALVYNSVTRKYVFTKQWRPGPENDILEIPAGVLDKDGEEPVECITREVKEETGYAIDKLQLIAEGFVSPGASTEKTTIYFAQVSHKINKGGGVESEDEEIEIVELTFTEMLNTAFQDFKTIIAVQWAKYNSPT
jgi:ADP-ribose pyrophosphatase